MFNSKGAGSHAEVFAVNELLLKRPNATLSDFAVLSIKTQRSAQGIIKTPCGNCDSILSGVQFVGIK